MSLTRLTNVVEGKEHPVWVKLSAVDCVIPHFVDEQELFMFCAGGRWLATRENPAEIEVDADDRIYGGAQS